MKTLAPMLFVAVLAGCATTGVPEVSEAERQRSATLALLCADVMDLYKMNGNPDVEPQIPSWTHFGSGGVGEKWEVVGYLTADDEIALFGRFSHGPKRSFYGVLAYEASHPDRYVVAIRGTATAREWAKDLEAMHTDTSWGEGVFAHQGFYSIYQSLHYRPKGSLQEVDAMPAILDAAKGKQLTVAGHSLGAPLAVYLTLDIAKAGGSVTGRYFASPRPGNLRFASEVEQRVSDYLVYRAEYDIVPDFPVSLLGFYYQALDAIAFVSPGNQFGISDDRLCRHHAITYAAMLQPTLMSVDQWRRRLEQNGAATACIL
jgi:pimeloyl-ACP methyl ester carboxylesterase